MTNEETNMPQGLRNTLRALVYLTNLEVEFPTYFTPSRVNDRGRANGRFLDLEEFWSESEEPFNHREVRAYLEAGVALGYVDRIALDSGDSVQPKRGYRANLEKMHEVEHLLSQK